MSKNAYTQQCAELTDKINKSNQAKGKSSHCVSRSDLENLTFTLLNTPDHAVNVYAFSKDGDSENPTIVEKKPVERYRASLKPVLKSLGLDAKDAEKIQDIPLPKEHAAAMLDVASTAIHDYMRAGRKFTFPITQPDETRMEIHCAVAPEKTSIGNRFKKDDDDGGETVTTTKERTLIKTSNPVPYWLKSSSKK